MVRSPRTLEQTRMVHAMTRDPITMEQDYDRESKPRFWTSNRILILLMILVGIACTVAAIWQAGEARGAEPAESYSFNPSDNADVDGFLRWIGMQKLTPIETVGHLIGLGMPPEVAYHLVGGASMHCATPAGFLGFYLEPYNPAPRALCNTPGRVFTPEEVQHMCRVWGTDLGTWFPGDGERPPEATCVRKVNGQPGATCVRKE